MGRVLVSYCDLSDPIEMSSSLFHVSKQRSGEVSVRALSEAMLFVSYISI